MDELKAWRPYCDDILLQENQSLREQIKILAHITYSYNPDVDLSKYLHNLGTEDYQLFIENNKKEKEQLKEEIKAHEAAMNEELKYRKEDQAEIKTLENVIQNKSEESKKLMATIRELEKELDKTRRDVPWGIARQNMDVIIKQALKDGAG